MSGIAKFCEMSYDEYLLYNGGAINPNKVLDGALKIVESVATGFTGQLYSGSQMFKEGVSDIKNGFTEKSHSSAGRNF